MSKACFSERQDAAGRSLIRDAVGNAPMRGHSALSRREPFKPPRRWFAPNVAPRAQDPRPAFLVPRLAKVAHQRVVCGVDRQHREAVHRLAFG